MRNATPLDYASPRPRPPLLSKWRFAIFVAVLVILGVTFALTFWVNQVANMLQIRAP